MLTSKTADAENSSCGGDSIVSRTMVKQTRVSLKCLGKAVFPRLQWPEAKQHVTHPEQKSKQEEQADPSDDDAS